MKPTGGEADVAETLNAPTSDVGVASVAIDIALEPENESLDSVAFDFEAHGQAAVSEYLKVREFYDDLSQAAHRIVVESIRHEGIKVNAVERRAKDANSFERKASLPSDDDPNVPKYNNPVSQITDLAGVRIITFFPGTLKAVHEILEREFNVVEHSDKRVTLVEEERFGYQSIHYLVKLKDERAQLSEYKRFADAIVEIQVRTILQHAWAEIEHDIQYKSASVIPTELRRRFMALAGLLELADREFQAIQDEDDELTATARASVEVGNYDVEITPTALKAYLDRRLGVDGRISDFSYQWTARLLRSLGFRRLDQVDQCISGYDDNRMSQIIGARRLGQTTRFEHMLLAGMGTKYIDRHPYASEDWFAPGVTAILERLRVQGVPIKHFDPL